MEHHGIRHGWVPSIALPFPAWWLQASKILASSTSVCGAHWVRDLQLHGPDVPLDVGSSS